MNFKKLSNIIDMLIISLNIVFGVIALVSGHYLSAVISFSLAILFGSFSILINLYRGKVDVLLEIIEDLKPLAIKGMIYEIDEMLEKAGEVEDTKEEK